MIIGLALRLFHPAESILFFETVLKIEANTRHVGAIRFVQDYH